MTDLDNTEQALVAQRQLVAGLKQKVASLRQQANNIRVVIPKRSDEDKLALQEQQTLAGAEAIMPYDPSVGMNWLQNAENTGIRREQVKDKSQQATDLATNRKIAADQYNEAVKAWSMAKEDPTAQNNMLEALGQARMHGLSLVNPLTNYTQEKQFASNLDQRKSEKEQAQKQWNANYAQEQAQFEATNTLGNQRANQDAFFRQQQLDLARANADLQKNKSLKLAPEEAQMLGQLEMAEPIIAKYERSIANDAATYGLIKGINSQNGLISAMANAAATSEVQQAAGAFNQVRNMIGRQLSGAAISSHEWSAFENNLPKLGDSPATLEQKRKFRQAWVADRKNGRGAAPAPTGNPAPTDEVTMTGWE